VNFTFSLEIPEPFTYTNYCETSDNIFQEHRQNMVNLREGETTPPVQIIDWNCAGNLRFILHIYGDVG